MTAALSAEQRHLIESYLGTTEEAAGLWSMMLGAHGAGVAWERVGWLAEGYAVPEEVVEALLTGLEVMAQGQSRDRLDSSANRMSSVLREEQQVFDVS